MIPPPIAAPMLTPEDDEVDTPAIPTSAISGMNSRPNTRTITA